MLVEIEAENEIYRGYIEEVITKTNQAKKVNVRLKTGEVGSVVHLVTREEMDMERFIYYNHFLSTQKIASIWDRKVNKYFILEAQYPKKSETRRYAYLFTDEAIANDVLSSLNDDRYMLRWINRKKKINENFKTLDVTHFRVNEERRVSVSYLSEREDDYLELAPKRSRKRQN